MDFQLQELFDDKDFGVKLEIGYDINQKIWIRLERRGSPDKELALGSVEEVVCRIYILVIKRVMLSSIIFKNFITHP